MNDFNYEISDVFCDCASIKNVEIGHRHSAEVIDDENATTLHIMAYLLDTEYTAKIQIVYSIPTNQNIDTMNVFAELTSKSFDILSGWVFAKYNIKPSYLPTIQDVRDDLNNATFSDL